jgi:hypothetical protein
MRGVMKPPAAIASALLATLAKVLVCLHHPLRARIGIIEEEDQQRRARIAAFSVSPPRKDERPK